MIEHFKALQLTVVELPIEFEEECPLYRAYLKELPFLAGEGNSKQVMYRRLMEKYQIYVETQREAQRQEQEEEMTSALLSVSDLMKYYDGETFDGFSYDFSRDK